MHEYSIVSALVQRVEVEAAAHEATGVARLFVQIGELSGVETELLATAFELFRDRGICAGAELVIERVPARWTCPTCETAIEAGGMLLRCQACDRPAQLAQGDEIILQRIELKREVPDV